MFCCFSDFAGWSQLPSVSQADTTVGHSAKTPFLDADFFGATGLGALGRKSRDSEQGRKMYSKHSSKSCCTMGTITCFRSTPFPEESFI